MNKTLATLAVGATLITGGTTVDLVPKESPMSHAEQWSVSEPSEYVTATGTIKNLHPQFEDTDGDGYVSAKVGYNYKGERVYEQIAEKDYEDFGKKGGVKLETPVKYSVTLAEAAIEASFTIAEAAIAFDAVYGINYFVGTSGTIAFTTSGTDRAIFVMFDNEGGPDDFTGVTFNGDALAEIGTRVQEGTTGRYSHTYALVNPDAGTYNVVISRSSSNQVNYTIYSLTGVNQTTLVNASTTQQFAAPIGTATTNLTTTVDNSWTVLHARGARTESASTGSTLRSASSIGTVMDSNGPITPAGATSMSFSQSPDNAAACSQMFSISPAAAAVDNTQNNGCHGEIHGEVYCQM